MVLPIESMDAQARRLLTAFTRSLNRANPQSADWERFSEFILYAYRHAPQTSEAVGHALVTDGLDWEEAEPFVLFHLHATRLLEREAAEQAEKANSSKRSTRPGKPRPEKRRRQTGRRRKA
jgi:hypothetical protein